MSKKSCLPGCLTVFTLAAVAAGGAYLYLRGQLPWQKFTPLDAAKVVPENAFATSFVSTDPKAWSVLAKYGTPEARDLVNRGLTGVEKELASDDLDYERDIRPWVGGVTFAFLPSTEGAPGVLMVVGIKDKLKANEFSRKLQEQKSRKITETDYNGTKISQISSGAGDNTYTAVAGDYLLVGMDRKVVEAAIDTYRGRPSLASNPEMKQLLGRALDIENPLARVYIDNYADIIAKGANLPPETLQKLQQIQGIVAGVGATDGGLHFQAVAKVDPATVTNLAPAAGDRLLARFPGDTLVLLTGNNLRQSWTELDRQATGDPNLQEVLRQIRGAVQMGGFDADRDIFGWMDGEFAVGLLPSSQALQGIGVGGLMIWETGNRQAAETTLDKLNQLVKLAPAISVEKTPIDGQEVTQWQMGGQTVFTYGWLDNDSLAVTLAIPYQARPTESIAANPNFRKSIAGFPKNNLGYFYVDVEGIVAKTGGLANIPADVNPEMKAFLESVKGVAMTATQPDKGVGKMDVLLTLKEVP
ncbi:DUF3352 domain-containing protein [Pannus brasiliensis CCIBt3594]|uniref:DUF3352 domain-containing protein n=1 Tax=Pannus brasiliensis CCIBt3594 TaxID=1427578 RepID=A0AAW9QPY9_9CHRO